MGENAPVSVLADRYASNEMRQVFAPEQKIIAERKLWLAVARAQSKLGHPISDAVIAWNTCECSTEGMDEIAAPVFGDSG